MTAAAHAPGAFRHAALFYDGLDDFLAGTVPFIADGLAAGEPVMVVVDRVKIDALTSHLGSDAKAVTFADMAEIGGNPARILPVWRSFVAEHAAGGHLRGIGEPLWPGRTPAEEAECQRHEALLNLAFAGGSAWSLLCPYDVGGLDASVVDEARRTHRELIQRGSSAESACFAGDDAAATPFDQPLPDPPCAPPPLTFGPGPLGAVRRFVEDAAARAGIGAPTCDDLVLAVSEVAANSIRHGGGSGSVRVWEDGGSFVCEVRDAGFVRNPLAGRELPGEDGENGRGLWLANHLCDLVELRSSERGTVVRLHVRRG